VSHSREVSLGRESSIPRPNNLRAKISQKLSSVKNSARKNGAGFIKTQQFMLSETPVKEQRKGVKTVQIKSIQDFYVQNKSPQTPVMKQRAKTQSFQLVHTPGINLTQLQYQNRQPSKCETPKIARKPFFGEISNRGGGSFRKITTM
jgi:hypothetical protein